MQQREIKFRAWNGKNVVPAACFKRDYEKMEHTGGSQYIPTQKSLELANGEYLKFDPLSNMDDRVMQFTGLQDRKGVDIYEGDIVANLGFFRGEVIFDDGIFTSEDRAGYYIDLKANGRWRDFKQLEVVGNIYEHADLLNGGHAKEAA